VIIAALSFSSERTMITGDECQKCGGHLWGDALDGR
jgi:hypothetical protein